MHSLRCNVLLVISRLLEAITSKDMGGLIYETRQAL
jgi:hypothetical protein